MQETRRNFLKAGCATVAGATMASGIGLFNVREVKAEITATHPYGWPIDGIDVAVAKDLGYQGYKGISRFSPEAGKHCASATFGTLIGLLREAIGDKTNHPLHRIPLSMMQWGSGGVAGFATLCGALNGASAAIGLVCSNSDAKKYIADLLTWYSETALPLYPSSKYEKPHVQSVADSNLCHVSVTNWCLASEYASGSSERSDRCACLSADVSAKVVEMLNSGVGGSLSNPRDKHTTCGTCHYKGKKFSDGQFTRGKMNCNSCHADIAKAVAKKQHGNGVK